MAIFATYPSNQPCGYDSLLLALARTGDEGSLNADDHFDFVRFVLSVFAKFLDNVDALIGDYCSTSKAFARRLEPHFVRCYKHRYNLAKKNLIQVSSLTVSIVRELMCKLSY